MWVRLVQSHTASEPHSVRLSDFKVNGYLWWYSDINDTNRIAHPNFGKRMYAYVDKGDSIVRLTPFLANDGQTFKSRFVSNAYAVICRRRLLNFPLAFSGEVWNLCDDCALNNRWYGRQRYIVVQHRQPANLMKGNDHNINWLSRDNVILSITWLKLLF